jgi:hypothetical protein
MQYGREIDLAGGKQSTDLSTASVDKETPTSDAPGASDDSQEFQLEGDEICR